ncbi:adhesin isopeptide-forming adherence domain-containing protein, partial [Ligilactobacillus equi]|uniref:adhesin isopeptide-forming adherence domain-containing protein n=1 Tax=Ligilactobacillus equi TaxID=137357 RepID=UPI0005580A86
PLDNAKFLNAYKGQKLTVTFKATVKDNATGDLKNSIVQTNDGHGYKTNTVTNHVEPNPAPVKVVVNSDGTNIDKTSVSHGQTVTYTGTWDLSELANHVFTKEELSHNWSFDDDYDQTKITANQKTLKVTDKSGKDITSQLDVNWNDKDGKWVVTPKDKAKFLEAYKGQKLTVSFNSVVKADATGDLTNTMNQVNDDQGYKTNTVTNHVENDPKPVKVVVNSDGTDIDNT